MTVPWTSDVSPDLDRAALLAQVKDLQDTLHSIRRGGIDAVIMGPPGEEQVYTLKSADRPYRLIVQEMDEGALTVSERGVVLYANPRIGALTGREVGELAGSAVSELFVAADGPKLAALLGLGVQEHARAELTLEGVAGPVPALVSAACLDVDGTVVICLVVTDLTEQKRVETTLRDSERRLFQFLDGVPVGLLVAEPGGRLAFVNRAGRRFFGESERPSPGQTTVPSLVFETGTDSPYPPSRLPLARALQGQDVHLDDLVLHPVGQPATPVEAWATPVRGSEGDIEYALAALVDISGRRRAEQVMAEQAAMLDLAHDAVIVWDAEARITYWNRGAQETYGYTRAQALGANVHDLLRTEFTEPVEDIKAEVDGHGQWDGELVQRTHEGRRLLVATRWAYHWGLDGTLLGTLEINRDVTARRDAEAELARRAEEIAVANDDLRRSNLDLEQFAYAASHDLSEPLRAISLPISMIAHRYQGRLDEQADQYIAFAVNGCRQMQALIEDLLLYSRVGRVECAVQQVDLDALVREVLAALAPVFAEVGAAVTVAALPVVTGDPTQLRQVFQNLLSNAVKFAAPDRRPEVCVAAERRDGEWLLTVTDNGIGIAPRHRERVFGMFKRLHTREDYPGTGIGLAITQKVVERHRGRVGVEDAPAGVGCRFWFTLPV